MTPLSAGLLFSDRIEALFDGRVEPQGVALSIRCMEAQALFRSVLRDAAFDLAELSLGSHIAAVASGRRGYVGLPVFPSRSFRHANLYVRTDRIREPRDLAGRTIGLVDFQQTAALWVRGLLADDYGVARESVRWVTAGLQQPVLTDRAAMELPPGIMVTRSSDTLDALLRRGEIDAVVSPRSPACFADSSVPVGRMWPDYPAAQLDWWRREGLFPIMHVLVLRRTRADAGTVDALCRAFDAALTLAKSDLARRDFPKLALPNQYAAAQSAARDYGDPWTYGIAANRPVLDRALRYAAADGLVRTPMTVEDLFD